MVGEVLFLNALGIQLQSLVALSKSRGLSLLGRINVSAVVGISNLWDECTYRRMVYLYMVYSLDPSNKFQA